VKDTGAAEEADDSVVDAIVERHSKLVRTVATLPSLMDSKLNTKHLLISHNISF
jgi:hypothetical protein